MYRQWGKRILDICLTLTLLAISWPVFILVAVAVKLESPSASVLHRTKRLAKGGSVYTLLKFRTMVPDAERMLEQILLRDAAIRKEYEATYKIRRDPRVTKVGRILRRLSLDELPQLINVLCGDMSLIGPRQILPTEIQKYGQHSSKLLSVRPGITGLWQVSGRSSLSYDDRVALDVQYIDNLNLFLDLTILLRTPGAVLWGDGAL